MEAGDFELSPVPEPSWCSTSGSFGGAGHGRGAGWVSTSGVGPALGHSPGALRRAVDLRVVVPAESEEVIDVICSADRLAEVPETSARELASPGVFSFAEHPTTSGFSASVQMRKHGSTLTHPPSPPVGSSPGQRSPRALSDLERLQAERRGAGDGGPAEGGVGFGRPRRPTRPPSPLGMQASPVSPNPDAIPMPQKVRTHPLLRTESSPAVLTGQEAGARGGGDSECRECLREEARQVSGESSESGTPCTFAQAEGESDTSSALRRSFSSPASVGTLTPRTPRTLSMELTECISIISSSEEGAGGRGSQLSTPSSGRSSSGGSRSKRVKVRDVGRVNPRPVVSRDSSVDDVEGESEAVSLPAKNADSEGVSGASRTAMNVAPTLKPIAPLAGITPSQAQAAKQLAPLASVARDGSAAVSDVKPSPAPVPQGKPPTTPKGMTSTVSPKSLPPSGVITASTGSALKPPRTPKAPAAPAAKSVANASEPAQQHERKGHTPALPTDERRKDHGTIDAARETPDAEASAAPATMRIGRTRGPRAAIEAANAVSADTTGMAVGMKVPSLHNPRDSGFRLSFPAESVQVRASIGSPRPPPELSPIAASADKVPEIMGSVEAPAPSALPAETKPIQVPEVIKQTPGWEQAAATLVREKVTQEEPVKVAPAGEEPVKVVTPETASAGDADISGERDAIEVAEDILEDIVDDEPIKDEEPRGEEEEPRKVEESREEDDSPEEARPGAEARHPDAEDVEAEGMEEVSPQPPNASSPEKRVAPRITRSPLATVNPNVRTADTSPKAVKKGLVWRDVATGGGEDVFEILETPYEPMEESEAAKIQPILKVRGPSTPVRKAAAAAERRMAAHSSEKDQPVRQVYVPPSSIGIEDVENRIPLPPRVPMAAMGSAAAVAAGGPPRKSSLFGVPAARTPASLVRPVSANRSGFRTPTALGATARAPAPPFTSGFGKAGGFKITRLQHA